MDDADDENALVKLTSLGVIGTGLLALFLGQDWFWLVFAVGFAVLVPTVKIVTDELGYGTDGPETPPAQTDHESDSKQDALDALRERYARGDLSEVEFERKVETLLETETPESAREHVERDPETQTRSERDSSLETESSGS